MPNIIHGASGSGSGGKEMVIRTIPALPNRPSGTLVFESDFDLTDYNLLAAVSTFPDDYTGRTAVSITVYDIKKRTGIAVAIHGSARNVASLTNWYIYTRNSYSAYITYSGTTFPLRIITNTNSFASTHPVTLYFS